MNIVKILMGMVAHMVATTRENDPFSQGAGKLCKYEIANLHRLMQAFIFCLSKIKDFSRTSKSLFNSLQGLKLMKNTDLSVKILLHKC